jgi:two-component system, OmpR family, response regulator ResD
MKLLPACRRGPYSLYMASRRVLVVDDEPGMARLLSLYLHQAGYTVDTAATGADAVSQVERGGVDLVVLDIGLPDIDGYSVCKHIRSAGNVPIIMLTARSGDRDRLLAFELGADDYVAKPFNPKELVARAHAVLRRVEPARTEAQELAVDGLVLSLVRRTVTVNGRVVELRPKEFDLLVELAGNADRVFTRGQLLRQVWGYDDLGDTSTVDVHIGRLRRKLGDSGGARGRIRTVRGVGYGFNVNAHRA